MSEHNYFSSELSGFHHANKGALLFFYIFFGCVTESFDHKNGKLIPFPEIYMWVFMNQEFSWILLRFGSSDTHTFHVKYFNLKREHTNDNSFHLVSLHKKKERKKIFSYFGFVQPFHNMLWSAFLWMIWIFCKYSLYGLRLNPAYYWKNLQ